MKNKILIFDCISILAILLCISINTYASNKISLVIGNVAVEVSDFCPIQSNAQNTVGELLYQIDTGIKNIPDDTTHSEYPKPANSLYMNEDGSFTLYRNEDGTFTWYAQEEEEEEENDSGTIEANDNDLLAYDDTDEATWTSDTTSTITFDTTNAVTFDATTSFEYDIKLSDESIKSVLSQVVNYLIKNHKEGIMLTFIFGTLFTFMFWVFYFGSGIIVTVTTVKRFYKKVYQNITYREARFNDFILVIIIFSFWPFIAIICLTGFVFKILFLKAVINIFNSVDQALEKENKSE